MAGADVPVAVAAGAGQRPQSEAQQTNGILAGGPSYTVRALARLEEAYSCKLEKSMDGKGTQYSKILNVADCPYFLERASRAPQHVAGSVTADDSPDLVILAEAVEKTPHVQLLSAAPARPPRKYYMVLKSMAYVQYWGSGELQPKCTPNSHQHTRALGRQPQPTTALAAPFSCGVCFGVARRRLHPCP